MIEDKELFRKTFKDVMIPVASILGYILLTILLTCLWFPLLFVMFALGLGVGITFIIYNDRLSDKKRMEERKHRGW